MMRLDLILSLSFMGGVAVASAFGAIPKNSLLLLVFSIILLFAALYTDRRLRWRLQAKRFEPLFAILISLTFFLLGAERGIAAKRAAYAPYLNNSTLKKIAEKGEGSRQKIRETITAKIAEVIEKEEHRAMASALLIGDKSSLSPTTIEQMRKSGASHALALSGMHVGAIWGLLSLLTALLAKGGVPRLGIVAANSLAIFVYAYITGFSPSVTRAAIMLVVWKFSSYIFARKNRLASISLAAIIVLFFSPKSLSEIGFMLSFAAVCGIALCFSTIESSVKRFSSHFGRGAKQMKIPRPLCLIAEKVLYGFFCLLGLSIVCQAFTLPIVLYFFGGSSKIALISSVTIVPAVTAGLYSAILSIITAKLPIIGSLTAYIANSIFELIELLSSFLGS